MLFCFVLFHQVDVLDVEKVQKIRLIYVPDLLGSYIFLNVRKCFKRQ